MPWKLAALSLSKFVSGSFVSLSLESSPDRPIFCEYQRNLRVKSRDSTLAFLHAYLW